MDKQGKQIRLAVDAIIQNEKDEVLLVDRKYEPFGWALPGGFVEYGETVEQAVIREVKEETQMVVSDCHQFHVYSDPARDPRGHTVGLVFLALAEGDPKGGDDAKEARFFPLEALPKMAFDHQQILEDFTREIHSMDDEMDEDWDEDEEDDGEDHH